MDTGAVTGFLEEVNRQLDATTLLKRIAYATDRIQSVGDSIKAFCPIHRDARFRTLLVDQKKHSFKCTIKTCPGYAGGTLVDLFALSRQLDPVSAANELIGALDLQVDTASFEVLSQSLLAEAETAFVNGEHERAEQAARQTLEFKPDCAEARLLVANIHIARGETSQASDEFIAVAETYLLANLFAEADELLSAAARMLPGNEDLVFMQVRSAELQGRKDEAVALLQEIAVQREGSGRNADNVGIYEQLLGLNPGDVDLRIKLGDVCEMRRDIKRACREWEQAADALMAGGVMSLHRARGALRRGCLKFEPQMNRLQDAAWPTRLCADRDTANRRDRHVLRGGEQPGIAVGLRCCGAERHGSWLECRARSASRRTRRWRAFTRSRCSRAEAAGELQHGGGAAGGKRGARLARWSWCSGSKFLVPDDLGTSAGEVIGRPVGVGRAGPRRVRDPWTLPRCFSDTGTRPKPKPHWNRPHRSAACPRCWCRLPKR
jgi:tetratricopeptide (TPR) repeat protein